MALESRCISVGQVIECAIESGTQKIKPTKDLPKDCLRLSGSVQHVLVLRYEVQAVCSWGPRRKLSALWATNGTITSCLRNPLYKRQYCRELSRLRNQDNAARSPCSHAQVALAVLINIRILEHTGCSRPSCNRNSKIPS